VRAWSVTRRAEVASSSITRRLRVPIGIFNLLVSENYFFGPNKMLTEDFRRRFGEEMARALGS